MKDTYLTISASGEGLFKDKGSKFLAFAYPVSHEDEIREIQTELKKKYYDARHHCYAWILGAQADSYRANDDGEPNHSAGDPILGQIRSRGLTEVLVVVVRYFGGTKLGVPGLINAYKMAAAAALDRCEKVEKLVTQTLEMHFEYSSINQVMKLVKDFDMEIIRQNFEMDCNLTAKVRLGLVEEVMQILENQPAIRIIESVD
ncbi:MAG: IMPACT family protein [Cyclobacteriaceae bacterium]